MTRRRHKVAVLPFAIAGCLVLGCASPSDEGAANAADLSNDSIAPQYAQATWLAAGPAHFEHGRPGAVSFIVIHDIDGTKQSAQNSFQSSGSNTSAQYIVGNDGSILQMVREGDSANHAGNSVFNAYAIGVEHEGFSKNPSGGAWPFPPALYDASARLVAHLAVKYGVPIDRDHIIGHYQVPVHTTDVAVCATTSTTCGGGDHHNDPGIGGLNWDWEGYMARVRQFAPPQVAPAATAPRLATDTTSLTVRDVGNASARWLVQCQSDAQQRVWRLPGAGAVRTATPLVVQDRVGDCGAPKEGVFPILLRGSPRGEVGNLSITECTGHGNEQRIYQVDGEAAWVDVAGDKHTDATASLVRIDPEGCRHN
jgi:N-acetyl-anhydromuramyl-L-alanine amidase AmpD